MMELFAKQGVSVPVTTQMVMDAYNQVKQGGEAAGTDGMGWEYLHTHRSRLLYQLWVRLASGSYFPKPIRSVSIPKKDGSTRKLGLPTLLDRIARASGEGSPGANARTSFSSELVWLPAREKHAWCDPSCKVQLPPVSIRTQADIKSYFDTIPHDKLLQALEFYCKEKWVSLYVSRWLKASIKNEDSSITQPQSGTPQGGVISPLLSNLYLHVVFDGWMQQHYPGIRFERYADDIIIHCRREQIAQSILNKLHVRFTACGLTLNPDKTQIVCLQRSSPKHSINKVHIPNDQHSSVRRNNC